MRIRAILLATALLHAPVYGQDAGLAKIKEKELAEVREQISALKESMDERAAERDRVTGELQRLEKDIAEKRVALQALRRQESESRQRKRELDEKIRVREAELAAETEQLEAQVRAAWMSGSQEEIRLLLNQQDPASAGRMVTYYRYISEYRGANISGINALIEELESLQSQAADESRRLAGLAESAAAEVALLDNAQDERRNLVASLDARIADESSMVARLAEQEKDLARLITELTSILSDYPITSEEPFASLKGRLTWPVAGSLLHDFGQPRSAGSVKWNGVVLGADRGREVRSVYHGRVVFADWLAGMGLLVIVDHGEGYMTLYGYNETTLKTAGDWVAPGDVIATVGDSGGQSRPSLYFELRKGTTPVNPRGWFSRQPRT